MGLNPELELELGESPNVRHDVGNSLAALTPRLVAKRERAIDQANPQLELGLIVGCP